MEWCEVSYEREASSLTATPAALNQMRSAWKMLISLKLWTLCSLNGKLCVDLFLAFRSLVDLYQDATLNANDN